MLYAVIACEQMYSGLHGMISYFVAEGTEREVEEMAIEESYAIMEEFSSIMEDLQEAAREDLGWTEEEFDEYMEDWNSAENEEYTESLNEVMQDNLEYEIYPIVKETNLSLEHLDDLFNKDPEGFIREYCNLPGFSNGYR